MREDICLGKENAEKVMRAFRKNPGKFAFIDVTVDELAQIHPTDTPPGGRNTTRYDIFDFRAGSWMVIIVLQEFGVRVSIINPYDVTDAPFTTIET